MTILGLALAYTIAYSAAIASYPALTRARRKRAGILLALSLPIILSPLWVPARAPFVRFLASLNAVTLLTHLFDLHIDAGRRSRPNLRAFLGFLPNIYSLVLRKLDQEPSPTRPENLARLARGLGGLVVGCAGFMGVFRIDWDGSPFLLEHSTKVLALYLVIIPGSAVGCALWRLAVGRARDFMDRPYLARTPADFWKRYNRPAQQFLHEDVFKQVGGWRSPARATLMTFLVSAIIHEYVVGIVIGRVQGYQTAFFLLQGLAVLATLRVKPEGWARIPWMVGTLAFNLTTSVLFFASLNGIVPFYSRPLPGWLDGWSLGAPFALNAPPAP